MFKKKKKRTFFDFSQFFESRRKGRGREGGEKREKAEEKKMERENIREIAIYSGKALPGGKGRPNHEIIRR